MTHSLQYIPTIHSGMSKQIGTNLLHRISTELCRYPSPQGGGIYLPTQAVHSNFFPRKV